MFDLINLAILTVAVLNLLLAVLILTRAPRNLANRIFGLVIVLVVLWQLAMFFYRGALPAQSLTWARWLYITASFVPSTFVVFSYLFPDKPLPSRWKILLAFLLNTLIILLLVHPNLVMQAVQVPVQGEKVIVWGPLYFAYVLYISGVFGWAYFLLIKSFLSAHGQLRLQLKFVLFGTLTTTILASITNLYLPSFGIFTLNWLGQIITVILVGAITYSIIKHRLMDVRLAVRGLILRVLVVLVLGMVLFDAFRFYQLRVAEITSQNLVLASALIAALLVLIYEPVNTALRQATDKFLFQREYSRAELLRNLSKVLAQSLDLAEVEEKIRQTLQEAMRVEEVRFVLTENPHELQGDPLLSRKGSPYGILSEQMRADPKMLVLDEVAREIAQTPESPRRERLEQVRGAMTQEQTAVALPLLASKGVQGLILLSEKKGGDAYTSNDLESLETLMYQAGVAIENASLYSETRQFNLRLQTEVKQATADLQIKNRNLTVLRRLDEIIINTLELDEMCQKIVDTIAWEMGFIGGLIGLLEGEVNQQVLRAKAISTTPLFVKVLRKLPKKLADYTLPLDLDPSNLLVRALRERTPQPASDFAEFYSPPLPRSLAQTLQKIAQISHQVAYPLSSKGKLLGVVVFGLPRPYENLAEADLDLLAAFMDQAGIAVDNALLYENLKGVNQQLKSANERLLELDRMKDELVSVASHELRTPMTAIKSYLWMAVNKYQDDIRNPKLKEYLARAFVSSERMIDLVNDMLSVSRIDTGRLQVDLAPGDLKTVIKSVLADLEVRAEEEEVEIVFEAPQGILPKALIDEDRIREVLMNLAGNALKYTPEGGRITFKLEHEDGWLKVSVADTGPGIAKEDLPRLFQKFGRLSGSFVSAAEAGGTGLGLYISKGIVELHGGKIGAKSRLGHGSTFWFIVRVANAT